MKLDMTKVKMELREFRLDYEVSPRPGEVSDTIDDTIDPVVSYWLRIRSMNSPLCVIKYAHLAQLALELLAIPVAKADSERAFSLVNRIHTEFRATLLTETLSALISCHFNIPWKCYELPWVASRIMAKKCTMELERNNSKRVRGQAAVDFYSERIISVPVLM